ncbi:MAG: nucleotidyl transferase AbiEii/AbiGii toxin family protein [Phascolarctobacterium sp.]|uniref:nucleotidyl transferase AbiEii/AbiGii toxin family protein n=1 Tax=Phascolarctobacterium sp. TaxID=2049039 RepID=UPI0026DBD031|nr:nucleotidyl transferase AbiEii/AbiGii toxin family protein [Phascolarctobacterium sp.]MDO4920302.1 nucleotidyl transferase AbiEii/AbiGii toxin family protein [Phascolarctobacterium sp.]
MSAVIEQMLANYKIENFYDQKNAMKEIMQEIVLCGLSRAGFFQKAAFYGGTALRIFYGLDRFSEDLDFSLETPDFEFDLGGYFPVLQKEVRSFGLNVEIKEKAKSKDSNIRSAFLKGNTKEHMLLFYADSKLAESVAKGEVVKIKFEIDVNPPPYATFEHKYRLLPTPYAVTMYDMPSLFAGKIHAVLCRAWQNRIKGRDLYDYVFYLTRNAACNQKHLRARLLQSSYIDEQKECSLAGIKEMLKNKFAQIDYKQAKQDVEPFIRDARVLDVWSADFFQQITEGLRFAGD